MLRLHKNRHNKEEDEWKGIRQQRRRRRRSSKVKKSTCFNFIHLQSHFWYQKVLFLPSAFLYIYLYALFVIFEPSWDFFFITNHVTSQTSQVSADLTAIRVHLIWVVFQPSFHFVLYLWMWRMKRCTSIDSFGLINNVYLVIAWMH